MKVFSQFSGFDWDDATRNKNWHRHKVAWWECEEVFFNEPLYVYKDERHSLTEERYYALGMTNKLRLLFVVFTRRGSKVRIVSGRDMHKKERKVFYEKAQKDSRL